MDINILAFELELGKGITMPELFDHIAGSSGSHTDSRYLYVARHEGWWRGLLLTARDIKAFSRMQRAGGHITLTPENLGESELAHFNYFILNEDKKRGLFQYYHGAASLNGFGYQLKSKYNNLKNAKIAAACSAVGAPSDAPPGRIKRKYSGYLSCDIVLRRSSFESLIRDLRQIRRLTIQFKKYIPGTRAFRPLASKAKVIRHKLSFRDQYGGALRDDVISLARSRDLKDLRGVGIGEDGLDRRFRLINEPETLGRFDFNDVVLNTEFDSSNVAGSMANAPMIARLHEIAGNDAWCMGNI